VVFHFFPFLQIVNRQFGKSMTFTLIVPALTIRLMASIRPGLWMNQ
jgi:hypothetical protein